MKTRAEHGTVQTRTGVILIVSGFLLATVFGYFDAREIALPFGARFVSMGMICDGAFLFWRGRQHRAKLSAETILADSNPMSSTSEPSKPTVLFSNMSGGRSYCRD